MTRTFHRTCLVLALALASGCVNGGNPTGTGTKPSTPKPGTGARAPAGPAPAPGVTPPSGPAPLIAATLTGKVKLLPAVAAGLLSNNSAGVVSNDGGRIISDNGSGLMANNGGGLIANNGGGLKRRLLAAEAGTQEWALADAEVAILDAQGRAIMGADGKPLTARTDQAGAYRFDGALPAGNVVLRVKLWTGGELTALLTRAGAAGGGQQDLNTATSLGAAFVLDRLVKGDQAKLDKLPEAETERLHADLEANRALLATLPTYAPAELATAAEALRAKAPAVDASLKAIEAILIGQAAIGDGKLATEVPINRPFAVAAAAGGDVLIAEYGMGRIRVVRADGTMGTLVDEVRGTIKRNFGRMNDLVRLPDGTIFVSSLGEGKVQRIKPDGTVEVAFDRETAGFAPGGIAAAPDGTLYVGERRIPGNAAKAPRIVAIAPGGNGPRELTGVADAPGGVCGLAVGADGALWVARNATTGGPGTLHRYPAAAGPGVAVATDLALTNASGFSLGPDGTAYVAEEGASTVLAIAPDGTRKTLAGPGGEAGAPPLDRPTNAFMAADGSLYVTDWGDGRVHVRRPDGSWRPFAGLSGNVGADGRAIALNGPLAVAFDAQDRLLIAENGRDRVVRYENGAITPVAGGRKGFAGDGGPATEARFDAITGITTVGDVLYVIDSSNNRIRRVDAGGTITTVAGGGASRNLQPVGSVGIDTIDLNLAVGIVADQAGRVHWTNTGRDQVMRLGAPDRVDVVAGVGRAKDGAPSIAAMLGDKVVEGEPAAGATLRYPLGLAFEPSGDLLVTDTAHGQVRRVKGLAGAAPTIWKAIGTGLEGALNVLKGEVPPPSDLAKDVALAAPGGLCVDAAGNVYLSELGSRRLDLMADVFSDGLALDGAGLPSMPARVWKFTPEGRGTIIAGPGGRHFTDPDADDALVLPTVLALSKDGRLAIADPGANLVRILPAGSF